MLKVGLDFLWLHFIYFLPIKVGINLDFM